MAVIYTPQQTQDSTSTGGINSGVVPQGGGDMLQSVLGMLLMKQGKYGPASTVFSKVGKQTAQQQLLTLQKQKGKMLNRQIDSLMNDWDKMSIVDRLPIPGISRISAARAKYDTARDAYTLTLNSMVADKRISDKEREYYRSLFPSTLSSKKAAQAKIDVLKTFVDQYNNLTPPDTTSNNTSGIEDILNMVQ